MRVLHEQGSLRLSGGVALTLIAGLAFISTPVQAQPAGFVNPILNGLTPNTAVSGFSTLTGTVRAKANADECYKGLGTNVKFDWVNQTPGQPLCASPKIPKVDQSYIWGNAIVTWTGTLAGESSSRVHNEIYFGTTSNGQCVTQGGITSDVSKLNPYEVSDWACEFNVSAWSNTFVPPGPFPPQIGDLRPPRIYAYDIDTKILKDITPLLATTTPAGICTPNGATPPTNPMCVDPAVQGTRGIRAGMVWRQTINGNQKTYVVFGSPALVSGGAVNWIAFDVTTRKAIAKLQIAGYDNQRRWIQDQNGFAYAPLGKSADTGGAVLRVNLNFATLPAWTPGSSNGWSTVPLCTACFTNVKVADMDGEGAYPTFEPISKRIFITTWPQPGQAGVYMSPPIPDGTGLTTLGTWDKIFTASNYEPDPTVVTTYAMGAIQAWNGYVYFGSMNVPWTGFLYWQSLYGVGATDQELQNAIVGTFRSIAEFRISNIASGTPTIELLYGAAQLPVYTPASGSTAGFWTATNNNMGGVAPKFGPSGFGNNYNNYTWGMTVWNNKLYVGTMDWSYMAALGAQLYAGSPMGDLTTLIPPDIYGGDIYVYPDTNTKATREAANGAGNFGNYGVRALLPYSATQMFVTGANAMNKRTSSANYTSNSGGGWELIELKPRSGVIIR